MVEKKLSIFLVLALFTSVFAIKSADPGFDIMNKNKKPIWIVLINGEHAKFFGKQQKVAYAGSVTGFKKTVSATIDRTRNTLLAVYTSDPKRIEVKKDFLGTLKITPTPQYTYGFKPFKSIYVSFKDGKLYPQTGPLGGFTKKSEAGYPLGNNVTSSDIGSW